MSWETGPEPMILQINEPRCRVCRDPEVRRRVNASLRWHGVPILRKGGRTHRITYTDVLRDLEVINRARAEKDQITYTSLWNHAKRHYDHAAVIAYWRKRMDEELRDLFGSNTERRDAQTAQPDRRSTKNQ